MTSMTTTSLLLGLVLAGTVTQAGPAPYPVDVAGAPVCVEHFRGYGNEWDPSAYFMYDLTDDDYAVIYQRIGFMQMRVTRMMLAVAYGYHERETFSYDAPQMRDLIRHLQYCQENNIDVILVPWGCETRWFRIPDAERVNDPAYAKIVGDIVENLIRERGLTCIRYLTFSNEPDGVGVGDFDRWHEGLRNMHAELVRRGLDEQLTVLGPDHFGQNVWLRQAVQHAHDVLDGYDFHRYAPPEEVRTGQLETYVRGEWDHVLAHDPHAATKPLVIAEAGMGGGDMREHPEINAFGYGLAMADYGVQAARAGTEMILAWMLDDNSQPGFHWGLWKNKEDGMGLRPWFFPWSLLVRSIPPGSELRAPGQPNADVRLLAARTPTGWTLVAVNRGDTVQALRWQGLPPHAAYQQYLYTEHDRHVNAQGFPQPQARVGAAADGAVYVELPAQSVLVLVHGDAR